MNIVQISRVFPPSVGGIENVVYGLSQALQRRGHRSDIVTLRSILTTGEQATAEAEMEGMRVYRLPHLGPRRYPMAPGVLSFLDAYDIVQIHAIDFFVDFISLTRRNHRKPLVLHTHGGIFHTPWLLPLKRAYFRTITRLSLSAIDAVTCSSQRDYDLFRSIVPAAKLHMIPNGVGVEPFRGITKYIDPGLILGLGRVAENKGIERVIEVLPSLAAEFPGVRLIWIGGDEHGQIPRLRAYADQLGVGRRVEFMGLIDDREVREWLSKAHVFVSAATYEAFGISTIEAMSSATVPVVTPVGVHPEVVHNGQTGFLCSFEAQDALNCLRRVLSLSKDDLEAIGYRAQTAAMRFSWNKVVDSYINLYQSLL